MIYLDHAATTPVRREARAAMDAVFDDGSGNPSSPHQAGMQAADHVAVAEAALGNAVHAAPGTLVWTSGATEATNLAIRGMLDFAGRGAATSTEPLRVVSCVTEHAATRDLLRHLEKERRVVIDWLPVDRNGGLDSDALERALARSPVLVSLMHVNNETGVIHDIPAIALRCHAAGVPLHVDAAQSLGRLPINVEKTPVALMSLSAHKLGGPPGIGALYIRKKPRIGLSPQLIGGGQQAGRRAGTLPTHQIAGFGAAVAAAEAERASAQPRYRELRDRLWSQLAHITGLRRNGGSGEHVAAPFLNVTIADIHGEALRVGLAHGKPSLAVSGGSACQAARGQSSYVLRAMGHSAREAEASLRFSLGPGLDNAAIDKAAGRVATEIARLRGMAARV